MIVKFFCPRWGSENLSWDDFLLKVKRAGYDGIEYSIANDTPVAELDNVWEKLQQYGLEVIPQHYDTHEANYQKHAAHFADWFKMIERYPACKINSQTGKDFFTFEQNLALINLADQHAQQTGIAVNHETHRSKFAFAAHITSQYLTAIPHLKLTLDISHWVNVAESYLDDQPEAIALALQRTEHIHSRIGYLEGPQIADPRAPEWQEVVNKHLNWWDKIVARKQSNGEDDLTITSEFGPYPYMVHLPYTQEPIASQWDINVYMMTLLKSRYCS